MTQPEVSELMVKGIVVGVFAENCWVIGSRRTREGIVIDPGDQAEDILHMAKEMGVNVKLIANSHSHVDHILGVRDVQAATNAQFLMHPEEVEGARVQRGLSPSDRGPGPAQGDVSETLRVGGWE